MAQHPSAAGRSTFPCRIALEDFTISVLADANRRVNMDRSRWEELQIRAEYDGTTQKSRWLALPLADEVRNGGQQMGRSGQPNGDDDASADSSLDIDDDEVSAAAGQTNATPNAPASSQQQPQSKTAAEMALLKERCVDVGFTLLNNCSFTVWFNADPEATVAADDGAVPDTPLRPRVKPKKVHFFTFNVEGSNTNRMGSLTGGLRGDKQPTSSSKEALATAASKSAAKVSAWARNTFLKLSSRSNADEASKKKAGDEAARQQALAAYAKPATEAEVDGGKLLERGDYATVVSGVDPSEAYNAPGGRKRFQLLLKPDSSKVPMRGTGVPVFLSFTMVAKYAEEEPVAVPRNFHRFAVVMDQVVLDLTEAATSMDLPGGNEGKGKDGTTAQRRITGYGFGLTSNSVVRGGQPTLRSVILGDSAIRVAEGSKVRSISFASHHSSTNERELTEEDYKRLPTSVCIVSASCVEGNKERVGNRRVTISRFKTSPTDGLCKPSYKCQLLLFIRRQLESGEIVEEPANQAIDLAGILNEEYYPPHIRQVRFSLGELMYVRLCRYCFVDSARHRAPLLMPYDFDNDGVVVESPSNEPVAGWILEANANAHHNHQGGGRAGTTAPTAAPGGGTVANPPPAHQASDTSNRTSENNSIPPQQQHEQSQPLPPPPPPPPPPRLQTMEERMRMLNAPQGATEPDSPPTPPLSPDNPFLTQASTTYTPEPTGFATDSQPFELNPFTADGSPGSKNNKDTNMFFRFGEEDSMRRDQDVAETTQQDDRQQVADDDFFGDWGSGTGAQANPPAVEITPEFGSDNPFFTFGNDSPGAAATGAAGGGAGATSGQAPVEEAGYFFGERNTNAFEITPWPDAPDFSSNT